MPQFDSPAWRNVIQVKTIKAIVAALTTLLGTIGTVIADGNVDSTEIGVVIAAVLVAYSAVYAAPKNAP